MKKVKQDRIMKKNKIWSMMLMTITITTIMVACGSDDSDSDSSMNFTKDMLVDENSYWDIKDITGNNARFNKGDVAEFYADGTCKGFHHMETTYQIKNGRLYTYYAQTQEPMFIYTLLSKEVSGVKEELAVRVDGTLDDKSVFRIVMRKNTKAASAH